MIVGGNSIPSILANSVKRQDKTIPIALPFDAEVFLKNGSSLSGRLTNIDSTQQKITVALSGQSRDVSVADINKVEFGREFKLIRSGEIVVRGNNSSNSGTNQKTWTESLASFRITNAKEGRAEITLNSISKLKLRGIRDVSENSSWVVDEIEFNHSAKKITLKVTPYSE